MLNTCNIITYICVQQTVENKEKHSLWKENGVYKMKNIYKGPILVCYKKQELYSSRKPGLTPNL